MAAELIVVVDDNAANRKLMSRLLAARGYDVRTATDGDDLERLLATCRPRLILMDLELPGTDGLELTQRLRADPSTRDVRIVAVTAQATGRDEERALAAGFDAFVGKPISTRALPELVATLLENRALPASRCGR